MDWWGQLRTIEMGLQECRIEDDRGRRIYPWWPTDEMSPKAEEWAGNWKRWLVREIASCWAFSDYRIVIKATSAVGQLEAYVNELYAHLQAEMDEGQASVAHARESTHQLIIEHAAGFDFDRTDGHWGRLKGLAEKTRPEGHRCAAYGMDADAEAGKCVVQRVGA
jgi:hypothetical protein